MCGIFGAITRQCQNPSAHVCNEVLELMSDRGPDDTGLLVHQNVILGHRRLSILDLSSAGHQPMHSEDELISIVFNGEIYNYREIRKDLEKLGYSFRTNTDTEVIIKAYIEWGTNSFEYFNGPFAFAIFDKRHSLIILARDRCGEKPLYIYESENGLYFSSDIRAVSKLSGVTPTLNLGSVASYLKHGFVLSDATLINSISSAKAGYVYTISTSDNTLNSEFSYIRNAKSSSNKITETSKYFDTLDQLLNDSVRLQLECDVPACISLSGGVDSSLITALASRYKSNLKTFTVVFPGDTDFDESNHARLVANHFSTSHTEIHGQEISPKYFEKIISKLDHPINDSSILPTSMVYGEISKQCKVALGGDGADELFGGYKHYQRYLQLNRYPYLMRQAIVRTLLPFSTILPPKFKERSELVRTDYSATLPDPRQYFFDQDLIDIVPGLSYEHLDFDKKLWGNTQSVGSLVSRATQLDFKTYLRNSILVKSDRASMMNSVEARAPFLDARIVYFAQNELPDHLKATSHGRKLILRMLCAKYLPEAFNANRKLGFNLPLGRILREKSWQQYINQSIEETLVFDKSEFSTLYKSHLAGSNFSNQLFGMLLLSNWVNYNNVKVC